MANEGKSKGRPEKNLRSGQHSQSGQQGGGGQQQTQGGAGRQSHKQQQQQQQQSQQDQTPQQQGGGKSRVKTAGAELLEGQGSAGKRSKRKP